MIAKNKNGATLVYIYLYSYIHFLEQLPPILNKERSFTPLQPSGSNPYTYSILIQETETKQLSFAQLKDLEIAEFDANSKDQPKFNLSLPSALYNKGLKSLHRDNGFLFQTTGDKSKYSFILPFVDQNLHSQSPYNCASGNIYFFCIRAPENKSTDSDDNEKTTLKDHFIFIKKSKKSSDKERVEDYIRLEIPTDYIIVHSSQPTLTYLLDNTLYTINSYYSTKSIKSRSSFVDTPEAKKRVEQVERAIRYNIPLIIEGETCSGKTFSVEQVCNRGGIPFIRYNFSPTSSSEDLIGDITIKKDGDRNIFVFRSGAFTEAFVNGYVLLLDEMSLASPVIIQAILSFLDSKQIYIDNMEHFDIRAMDPNFRIIATQNPAGSEYKRTRLSDSIKDYFRVLDNEQFPPISADELNKITERLLKKQRVNVDSELLKKLMDVHCFERDAKSCLHKKMYTLRDINRMISILSRGNQITSYNRDSFFKAARLVYNLDCLIDDDITKYSSKMKYIIKYQDIINSQRNIIHPNYPMTFINASVFTDFYNQIDMALSSGSHVLVCADDEFIARRYTYAFLYYLNDKHNSVNVEYGKQYSTLYCSKAITSEQLIGSSQLIRDKKTSELLPKWIDSPLVESIIAGKICVLQNMGTMNSNSLERLNNILEIEFHDKNAYNTVRFDERPESDIEINNDFRIISTCSIDDLKNFSPALNNRFIHIVINIKDYEREYDDIKNYKEELLFSSMCDEEQKKSSEIKEQIKDIINKNSNQSFYDCKNMLMKKWFLHKNSYLKDEFKDDIINKFVKH